MSINCIDFYLLLFLDKNSSSVANSLSVSTDMLLNVFVAAVNDPINNRSVNRRITPGNEIKLLAEDMLSVFQRHPELLSSKSNELVAAIANSIKSASFTKAASRELMWKNVLVMMQDKKLSEKWNNVFTFREKPCKRTVFSALFYFVCMEVIKYIIKFENDRQLKNTTCVMADLKLTDEEQQVIYYVAGYIVFSILKKYRNIERNNPRNATCSAAIQFLLSLKLNGCENLKAITCGEVFPA